MASNRLTVGVFLGMLLVCGVGTARAASQCPWLNAATASGILSAAASESYVEAAAEQPGTCTFTSKSAAGDRVLSIAVEISSEAHARLGVLGRGCRISLPALGNEAVECAVEDRRSTVSQRVVGRVRDQVFTIAISSSVKNDGDLRPDELKNRLAAAAEQVAGNLF
jgi:hypothetical protein